MFFENLARLVVVLVLVSLPFGAAAAASILILVFALGVNFSESPFLLGISLFGLYIIGYITFSISLAIYKEILK